MKNHQQTDKKPKKHNIIPRNGLVAYIIYDNLTLKKLGTYLSRFTFTDINRKMLDGTYSNITMVCQRFHCSNDEYLKANLIENSRQIPFEKKEEELCKVFPDIELRLKQFQNWFEEFCNSKNKTIKRVNYEDYKLEI